MATSSALAAVVSFIVTGDVRLGFMAFAAVLAVSFAIRFATLRGFLAATFLFLVPPGVLGESAASLALLGSSGLLMLSLTYRSESSRPFGGRALAVAAMAAPAAGLALLGQWPFVASYALLAVAAFLIAERRGFVRDLLRGLVVYFSIYVASYLATIVVGFRGSLIANIEIGHRTLELYAPLTLATSGAPILEGTRRGAPFIGEPGLVVFYLLPLVAALFVVTTTRVRVGLSALIVLVTLLTQSTATILIVFACAVVGLTLIRMRRRSIGTVVLVCASAALAVPAFLLPVFDQKNSVAGVSIAARGIGADGGHANINILVALSNDPALAGCLILGLVLAAFVAFNSIPGTVIWLGFAVSAVTAQPSQWQVGAWFVMLAFALVASPHRGLSGRGVRPVAVETRLANPS
ncbi:hypothetical protein [Microbacterium dauci]|uniref:Uncharacterized protein n=1 Tax=Microbacterium dauci TaxID=3048008 RepID=A0ABT6ZE61_9MICO|nr:hypothetical protein [Microbacterium sp. LX3-4]MDJ1114449.1 hypothetical protein [Microbacterium sp. LX3-4]